MTKVFYRESDLKIMGMSDGADAMDFPYIETPETYHTTENMEIVREGGDVKLIVKEIKPNDIE